MRPTLAISFALLLTGCQTDPQPCSPVTILPPAVAPVELSPYWFRSKGKSQLIVDQLKARGIPIKFLTTRD